MGFADVLFLFCIPVLLVVYEVGYFKYRRRILEASQTDVVDPYGFWISAGDGKWTSLVLISCAMIQLESKKLLARKHEDSPYLYLTDEGQAFLEKL